MPLKLANIFRMLVRPGCLSVFGMLAACAPAPSIWVTETMSTGTPALLPGEISVNLAENSHFDSYGDISIALFRTFPVEDAGQAPDATARLAARIDVRISADEYEDIVVYVGQTIEFHGYRIRVLEIDDVVNGNQGMIYLAVSGPD